MKKSARLFLAVPAFAVLALNAGCSGDGGSNEEITNSLFAGTYVAGTFTATGGAAGPAQGTVAPNGRLETDLILTSHENQIGTLNGTIDKNGTFSGELNSPSLPAPFRPLSITGEFERTATGIRGEFSRTVNGQPFTATLVLSRTETE